MRVVDAICLAVAISGAAYVYNVKHQAEIADDARRALEREIAVLSGDVSLLEADLAALERPGRLESLVASLPEAFPLEPVEGRHYVRLADIPMRSAIVPPVDATDTGADPREDMAAEPGEIQRLLQELSAPRGEGRPSGEPGEAMDRLADLLRSVTASPDAPLTTGAIQ